MDSANTSNVTDDQELAKVLESMNQQATAPVVPPVEPIDEGATADPAAPTDGLAFEETPVATPDESTPIEDTPAPTVDEPVVTPADTHASTSGSSELDSIKKSALEELRPLVDKLDLPADEKFDTLLLIIRSTDDKTLVNAAHEAARAIPDETKRAQALLDVIKEIDYFSGHGQQPTS